MFEDSLQYSIIDSRQDSQRIPSFPPPPDLNRDHQDFITQQQDNSRAQLEQLQQDLLYGYQKIEELKDINSQQKAQDENKLHQMQQHFQLEMKRIQADNKSQIEEIKAQYLQQIQDLKQKMKERKKKFKSKEQFLTNTAEDYRKSLQGNELLSKQLIADKAKTIANEQSKQYCEIIEKFKEEKQKLITQIEDLQGDIERLKEQINNIDEQGYENQKTIVNLEEENQKFKSQNQDLQADNEKLKQQVLQSSETIKQLEKKDQIPTKIKQNSNHINDQKPQQFTIQTNVYINRQRGTGSRDQQDQRLVQNQFFTQPNFSQPIHSIKSLSQQKQKQGNNQKGIQQLAKQVSPNQNNRYIMDVQGSGVKPPKPFANSLNLNQSQTFDISRNIQTSNSSRNLVSASPGNKYIK